MTVTIDKALAAGIDREIKARRRDAVASDRGSSHWTDRDVGRRMSEAGRPMDHPAVSRMRTGLRKVSTQEWLTVAFVLSVAPLTLIDTRAEPVSLGAMNHKSAEIRDWIAGLRPLDGVAEKGIYYATAGATGRPQSSVFSATLRALADQFDTAQGEVEMQEIAEQASIAGIDSMKARRKVRMVATHRDPRRKPPLAQIDTSDVRKRSGRAARPKTGEGK